MRMIIGLTGRVGVGKSFVASLLVQRFDVLHLDLDVIGHEILLDSAVQDSLMERFGLVDRPGLGAIVFSDKKALQDLNAIMHPRMKVYVLDQLKSAVKPVIISGALLDEIGLLDVCDQIWVVDAPDDVIRDRIGEKFDKIASVQRSRDVYLEEADVVFHNVPDEDIVVEVVSAYDYFVLRSGHD